MALCPSMHSDLRSDDFRHFLLIVGDTLNKQPNPTSCQLVPLYLMFMKISFPHRDTGKKILDKKIDKYPQLAGDKGRASQRQWGAKTIVPQDRPGANRRADAQEAQAWDRESLPAAVGADPRAPGSFPGAVTSPSRQGFHRGRERRATLLLGSKFPI